MGKVLFLVLVSIGAAAVIAAEVVSTVIGKAIDEAWS